MSSRKDLTAQERARLSPGQIAHGQPRPAGVAQSKAVARPVVAPGQQNVRRPVAPPPYRPQPVPKVLQTKPAIAGRATAQPSPNRAAPSAPPSRRPQPVPPNANARGTAAGVNAPRPFGASQRGGPTQGRAVASVPARVKPPALGGGGSGVRAGMKHGPASVQLKPGTPRPCCPRHSSVVQLNDPKYVKPLDYGTRTAPKGSSEYQYTAS